MTMDTYNGDLLQAMKWAQNNAPKIQALVTAKDKWYNNFQTIFWNQWEANSFDIRTADNFGLQIWCIILGVSSSGFGLYPASNSWAYGKNRQNFKYSGTNPNIPEADRNEIGGNFYGAGDSEILNLNEIRKVLRLRYVALVSNGNVAWINKMIRYIFNDGEAWDFGAKNYFYLADSAIASQPVSSLSIYSGSEQSKTLVASNQYSVNTSTGTITMSSAPANGTELYWSGSWGQQSVTQQLFGTGDGSAVSFTLSKPPGYVGAVESENDLEYRIGANLGLSVQLVNLMNEQPGLVPTLSGKSYKVIIES